MIRFRLRELMAEKGFQDGRLVTLKEIADATGIHRTTLTRIASSSGCNATTDNLDKLCEFFDCELQDLAQYVKKPSVTEEN